MPIKNTSLKAFRKYLEFKGLRHIKTEGGHEKWIKQGMHRPVIIETHIDPVPEFIVRNNLGTMGSNKKELEDWLSSKKK